MPDGNQQQGPDALGKPYLAALDIFAALAGVRWSLSTPETAIAVPGDIA